MRCAHCGHEIRVGGRCCKECGTPVAATAEAADDARPLRFDQLVPIDKKTLAALSRKLDRAAIEGKIAREVFDRLHAALFARDKTGVAWTIGLRSSKWNRAESGRWVPGEAPEQLLIEPETLAKLQALAQHVN
jgi:hypothetical protein